MAIGSIEDRRRTAPNSGANEVIDLTKEYPIAKVKGVTNGVRAEVIVVH